MNDIEFHEAVKKKTKYTQENKKFDLKDYVDMI